MSRKRAYLEWESEQLRRGLSNQSDEDESEGNPDIKSDSESDSEPPQLNTINCDHLPVFKHKQEILDHLATSQFIIVAGETGSGKTTQIPQYLLDAGIGGAGLEPGSKAVVCTQPRRLAATSVADRVAKERGQKLGLQVGYSVRFDDRSSRQTKLKFVTDGILLRELQQDPNLSRYGAIMVDEAHERGLQSDVLLAFLKQIALLRPEFKVVIASATLNAEKFSQYFGGAPILNVSGRQFPVEIYYSDVPEPDYVAAAVQTAMQIHAPLAATGKVLDQSEWPEHAPPGDILIFLPGQDEIEECVNELTRQCEELAGAITELIVLPLYSSLPSEQQSLIFAATPEGARKCVVATNIAETSLTIDGIVNVIDCGLVKENIFEPRKGINSLVTKECSKASAAQRAGRAGRTQSGNCYRLYTKQSYKDDLPGFATPEILRVDLSGVCLMLMSIGVTNVLEFDLLDKPSRTGILSAMEQLYMLGALSPAAKLTKRGLLMASLPTAPTVARTLLASNELGCLPETAAVLSMLNVQSQLFVRPPGLKTEARAAHAAMASPQGDHMTLLNIYKLWTKSQFSKAWCRSQFLQHKSLVLARKEQQQLVAIVRRIDGIKEVSEPLENALSHALVSGFFGKLAKINKDGQSYQTMHRNPENVLIHPSSALAQLPPELPKPRIVLYNELVLTSREFMRGCSKVEVEILARSAPQHYKKYCT